MCALQNCVIWKKLSPKNWHSSKTKKNYHTPKLKHNFVNFPYQFIQQKFKSPQKWHKIIFIYSICLTPKHFKFPKIRPSNISPQNSWSPNISLQFFWLPDSQFFWPTQIMNPNHLDTLVFLDGHKFWYTKQI